ncbi:MAG TPA: DUF1330 domain-containing protein [Gaiellaceae bacterium]
MRAYVVNTKTRTRKQNELDLYAEHAPTFMAEARAWYESPAYQEASRHRFLGGDYDVVIVDGLSPTAVH